MRKPWLALFLIAGFTLNAMADEARAPSTVPQIATVPAATVSPAPAVKKTAVDLSSPVGLWRTIDESGEPKSLVRITMNGSTLSGIVEKVLPAGMAEAKKNGDAIPICRKCEGTLKNQPVQGLMIIEGLKKDGDEFDGGTILDPSNGKVYKCSLRLDSGGKKLVVGGFIGISLFGRSQTWERVE